MFDKYKPGYIAKVAPEKRKPLEEDNEQYRPEVQTSATRSSDGANDPPPPYEANDRRHDPAASSSRGGGSEDSRGYRDDSGGEKSW